MDKTVALLNIENLRKKLVSETDEVKRQAIIRLISEEEAKALALEAPQRKTTRPSGSPLASVSGARQFAL